MECGASAQLDAKQLVPEITNSVKRDLPHMPPQKTSYELEVVSPEAAADFSRNSFSASQRISAHKYQV